MKTLDDFNFKVKRFGKFHFDFENDGFLCRPKKAAKVYAVSMKHLELLAKRKEISWDECFSVYEVIRANPDTGLLQVVGVIKKDDEKKQKSLFTKDDQKVLATVMIRDQKDMR